MPGFSEDHEMYASEEGLDLDSDEGQVLLVIGCKWPTFCRFDINSKRSFSRVFEVAKQLVELGFTAKLLSDPSMRAWERFNSSVITSLNNSKLTPLDVQTVIAGVNSLDSGRCKKRKFDGCSTPVELQLSGAATPGAAKHRTPAYIVERVAESFKDEIATASTFEAVKQAKVGGPGWHPSACSCCRLCRHPYTYVFVLFLFCLNLESPAVLRTRLLATGR